MNIKTVTKSNKSNKPKEENNKTSTIKKSIEKYSLKYYFCAMLYMKLNYSYKENNLAFCVPRNFHKSFIYFRNILDITTYIKSQCIFFRNTFYDKKIIKIKKP